MTPETAEKQAVKQYLDLKGVFHFPLTQGLGTYKGAPDRIAIKAGKVYAIEIKAGSGKQSDYQKQFQQSWEANGGIYLLGGLEDIMKIL